jgi:hypothetical protein
LWLLTHVTAHGRSMNTIEITTTHTIDLPYEINTLRQSSDLLPKYGHLDVNLKNLIVEGFWLHARNLIELFLQKRNATDPHAIVRAGYSPKDEPQLGTLYRLICNQITHLADGRPVRDADKLDCGDPANIRLLEDEIANFISWLNPTAANSILPQINTSPMEPAPRGLGPTRYTSSVGEYSIVGSPKPLTPRGKGRGLR